VSGNLNDIWAEGRALEFSEKKFWEGKGRDVSDRLETSMAGGGILLLRVGASRRLTSKGGGVGGIGKKRWGALDF